MIINNLNLLSKLSPNLSSKIAWSRLQQPKAIVDTVGNLQRAFYRKTSHFKAYYELEDVNCYEMGDPVNPTTLLIHDWNLSAASLHEICNNLVNFGHHVISMDLPAHGKSKLSKTNLIECSEALKMVLMRLNPNIDLNIVSHAMGSTIVAHALANSRFKINKWVQLSGINYLQSNLNLFKDKTGMSNRAYEYLLSRLEGDMGKPLSDFSEIKNLNKVSCNQILILFSEKESKKTLHDIQEFVGSNLHVESIQLKDYGNNFMLNDSAAIEHVMRFLSTLTSDKKMELSGYYKVVDSLS